MVTAVCTYTCDKVISRKCIRITCSGMPQLNVHSLLQYRICKFHKKRLVNVKLPAQKGGRVLGRFSSWQGLQKPQVQ